MCVLVVFVVLNIRFLILFVVLTSWNPYNNTRVTFKVFLLLLNALREYLQQTVFRHVESYH